MLNIREIEYVVRNEHLAAISISQVLRTSFFILLMLFTVGIAFGQSHGDTYFLHRGGDSIQQKETFLLLDADSVQIIEEGSEKLFNYKGNSFKSIFDGRRADCDEFPKTVCMSITELYRMEEIEIKKQLDKVEEEKGFRPVPPIRHMVLKVNLILRRKNECVLYEVDWI